jgi:quercetin dioxygenase-like cupin family protein
VGSRIRRWRLCVSGRGVALPRMMFDLQGDLMDTKISNEPNGIGAVKHHFSGGVYAKEMRLKKGHTATTHKHTYDHMSVLASGSVIVSCDGVEKTYTAPHVIEIKKNVNHSIHALEDTLWLCIHKVPDEFDGNIDEVLIKE